MKEYKYFKLTNNDINGFEHIICHVELKFLVIENLIALGIPEDDAHQLYNLDKEEKFILREDELIFIFDCSTKQMMIVYLKKQGYKSILEDTEIVNGTFSETDKEKLKSLENEIIENNLFVLDSKRVTPLI